MDALNSWVNCADEQRAKQLPARAESWSLEKPRGARKPVNEIPLLAFNQCIAPHRGNSLAPVAISEMDGAIQQTAPLVFFILIFYCTLCFSHQGSALPVRFSVCSEG